MHKSKCRKTDPLENIIEAAFEPGQFISDRGSFSFVSGLDSVVKSIESVAASNPKRTVTLYETVLAACHAKVEELDDSSGNFGIFAKEVICGWIRARQRAGADPSQTAATFLSWMDDDPYAFCYGIEKDLCKAFDRSGLAAFETLILKRYEAAPQPLDYAGRHSGQILREIYLARKATKAYEKLAEAAGFPQEDCLALAKLHAARNPQLALAWVERGLASRESARYSTAAAELEPLHRELLAKVGRRSEALESAWKEFLAHPCKFSLDDVLRFAPAKERALWREKALDAANGDFQFMIDLFVEAKEKERLTRLFESADDDELKSVSHFATEPAAKMLQRDYPAVAARLWRAQALRILDAGKSRYDDAAIDNLDRARKCFIRAGLEVEWERTFISIRKTHFRKLGFMRDFDRMARGEKAQQPTFLESAKAKWLSKGTA